jgi:hypothetical protein
VADFSFDPVAHVYTLDGKKLPGVTSILALLGGYEGIPERVLRKAADRGTAVHAVTEMDDAGTLDYGSLDDELTGYLMGWHRFKDEMKPEILDAEVPGYHSRMLYAGTRDRRLILHGKRGAKLSILDIKSSYMLMPSTGPQTAAYAEIYNETAPKDEQAKNRYGLRLTKDGNYELHEYKDPGDFNVFVSALNCFRFVEKHNKALLAKIEAYQYEYM